MATELKTEAFLIRLGRTEARMLAELADRSGLSRADIIRQAIRREHASSIGSTPSRQRRTR